MQEKGVRMKKVGLGILVGMLVLCGVLKANAVNPTYMAPNAGNMNFYPLMHSQMEQEETLDFINKSKEEYKKDREKKNNEQKMRESKFNPNYAPNYGGAFLHPVHPVQMQFTKDENGNIRIQGIHSNSEKIINTDK